MTTLSKISSPETRSDILVYNGQGVNSQSTSQIVEQFGAILDGINFKVVDGHYLLTQSWEKSTWVLIGGAGVCKNWDEELGAEGIARIRQFVLNNGNYIGFCAGAYYGCRKVEFAQTGQPKIVRERALAFFNGTTRGPLFPTKDYSSLESARAIPVTLEKEGTSGKLYYQGGGHFLIHKSTRRIKILARSPTQITGETGDITVAVLCKVGKGKAILSCYNPQFRWHKRLTKVANPVFAKLAHELAPHEDFRRQFLVKICKEMGLPLRTAPLYKEVSFPRSPISSKGKDYPLFTLCDREMKKKASEISPCSLEKTFCEKS
jgi:biotin---protein ligase